MNQERWQRLKTIVADALEEESPAARTAILNQACADDPALLREAESYLRDADTTSGHDSLEECAAVASAAVRRDGVSMMGRRVGAYVIIRELGHGGMATVYLAARADGYFSKQVAIKVLKLGGGNSAELLERFRGEREVLASLEHSNIATLFDAGTTEEGMPYFVMEYVPGSPVTTYVREHHLSIRDRLALFLKICSAVEVAHRKRIVHRDLKRSNILVNEEGTPKLLDFGIAKLLEENPLALTATGQQRLTPISASPEQARGEEVTTVSDVYALGALLYEMLTGHTPHLFPTRSPDLDEVVRVVSECDPILPSLAGADHETERTLRGDLDAIILQAMRKNPAERYPTVDDLAGDIRHYLAGEAVRARPDRLNYRVQKFVGRHKVSPARLALGALAILAVVGATMFLTHRHAQSIAKKALPRATVAIPEKSIAVLPFDDFATSDGTSYFADGVQDDILTDLAKAEDLKVISRSGVAPYRKGPRDLQEIGQNLGVAYVLEGSVRRLDNRVRVNAQLIDARTDTQAWAEQYDRKIDDLFALQSDLAKAIVVQLKGKLSASARAAIESRPTSDVEAYDFYLRARVVFAKYEYDNTVDLLNQAVARDPNFALAYCLLTNAHLYAYRFGGDQTEERLSKAKNAAETALRLAPQLPEAHLAMAHYYYNGLRDYEKTLSELAVAPPSPDSRAKFFDLTALTERRLGRWKEAVRDGEKALEIDPHDPFIPTEVIQSYLFLRRYADAEKLAHRASQLIQTQNTPFLSLEIESILAQGEPARARAVLEASTVDPAEKHDESAQIAFYEHDFAKAMADVELARSSKMAYEGAGLDLMEGAIARAQGDAAKAWETFEKARQILEKKLQHRPEDASTLADLAWAYAGLGRKEDALKASQQAVFMVPSWRDAVEGPELANMQAQTLAWVGEKDAAINQLASLVKQPRGPHFGALKFDPGWAELRGDPRFEKLVAETVEPISLD